MFQDNRGRDGGVVWEVASLKIAFANLSHIQFAFSIVVKLDQLRELSWWADICIAEIFTEDSLSSLVIPLISPLCCVLFLICRRRC